MKYRILSADLASEVLGALCYKIARVPPFSRYPFGLMVGALIDQLRHRANLVVHHEGRVVAYIGWVHTSHAVAEAWMKGEGRLLPDWKSGEASVVTIFQSDHREYIAPLIREFARVSEGRRVYRKRVFADGRPEHKRPPLGGQRQERRDPDA